MSRPVLATIALVITQVLWGSSFVATKMSVDEFHPFTLAVLRFVIASAILVPLAWCQRRRSPRQGQISWPAMALLGLTGVTLFYATYHLGMAQTTATKGALIHGVIPATTALLAVLALRERVTLGSAAGIALSIAGVFVIVAVGGDDLSGGSLVGDAFIMASALVWSAFIIIEKKLVQDVPAIVTTACMSVFGLLFLAPFSAYELATAGLGPITPAGLVALAYLAVGSSAVAYLLWNFSLSYLSASQVGVYSNLVPVVGVVAAALLLGEAPVLAQLAGGALVLIGVYLAGRRPALEDAGRTRQSEVGL